MKKEDLRIVYMGTPDFAVPGLEILIENNFNVVAVITAPDKPSGRGLKINVSAVKECALKHNLNILQPTNLKDPEFIESLKACEANLGIVVAFRMLPEMVWNMPTLGTFNLHGSLLPQYRGAAPINWAIINGDKETGCTTFFLKHEIDTGDIIEQYKEPIHPEDTFEDLYNRMKVEGAKLILNTVNKIVSENYTTTPQVFHESLKPAPKIFKETGFIDWSKDAASINNLIRGLCPFPSAWTKFNDKVLKIYKAKMTTNSSANEQPGTLKTDDKKYLKIATKDYYLQIEELQLEGKKRMNIEEFLRGNKINK